MNNFRRVVFLMFCLKLSGAFPQSGLSSGGGRTRRDVPCRDGLEYPSSDICCLNCPAGTRLISPCTRAGQKGKCEECNDGTYTEHGNGLSHCFPCTQCRSDQDTVRPCTHTQDAECQCKAGRFCADDQACEVCRKCSSCAKDEVLVRNCTPTTNTECKKIQANADSQSDRTFEWIYWIVAVVAGLLVVVVVAAYFWGGKLWNYCKADSRRNGRLKDDHRSDNPTTAHRQLVRTKSSAGVDDEHKGLCESLSSSASNSQHSLTAFPAPPRRASPVASRQPNRREDEQLLNLVPANGEESLRKCFDYFEEMDIRYHKRFFRNLGITDNEINSKEHLTYDEKVHDLLNIWLEKEGREATLNDLLKALLDLTLRRTAENIREKAIGNGHYSSEH